MNNLLIYISAIIALSRFMVINIPISINVYYGYWALIAVIVASKGLVIRMNCVLLLLVGLISIALNSIDPIFQPELRLFSFGIMLFSIGPLNKHKSSIVYRMKLFRVLSGLIILMTILSFFLYFSKASIFFHSNGLYKGVFNHSMALGPMSGISAVICLQYVLTQKRQKMKIIMLIFCVMSILSCLLSGSRGALLSTLIGIIVELILMYRKRTKEMLKKLCVILFVGIVAFPVWYTYAENIRMKQEANKNAGSSFFSREVLWNDRLAEIEKSPIIGSGFAAMNKHVVTQYANDEGGVEPGSSWLFLLSSLGIIGFTAFFNIAVCPILKSFKKNDMAESSRITLLSILTVFFIHMFFEGYVISSGSFLFLYLWLSLGLIQSKEQSLLNSHRMPLFEF